MSIRTIALLGLVLLVALGAYAYIQMPKDTSEAPQQIVEDELPTMVGGETQTPTKPTPINDGNGEAGIVTTLRGTITCLPHKGDGPHTMECAFGLKADNGNYYSLINLWEVAPTMQETNVRVEVMGALSTPAPDEKYNIEGDIIVMSVEKI